MAVIPLAIEIMEATDATSFNLYDLTVWTAPYAFASGSITSLTLTLVYDGVTYTYVPAAANLKTEMGIGVTYVNLCGTAINSAFVVTPDHFYAGAVQLNPTYFPDGYYEITLSVVHTYAGYTTPVTDSSHQGFLAENYIMASKLPLTIDINNFDYEENRLQFLCIAMLRAATWAAELGRQTEFEEITTKVNDFLDARSINEIWST
jgi:hypothetical protein